MPSSQDDICMLALLTPGQLAVARAPSTASAASAGSEPIAPIASFSPADVSVWPCLQVAELGRVLKQAWQALGLTAGRAPRHLALAIAGSVQGDTVLFTQSGERLSVEALRLGLQLDTLLVVNDFTALAMALPHLAESDSIALGDGVAQPGGVIGLIGPGEGLGVSGLIPAEDRRITLGSEGGHISFAPSDETELRILQAAWRQWPHVSAERLVSAEGLRFIWQVLGDGLASAPAPSAAAIIEQAHRFAAQGLAPAAAQGETRGDLARSAEAVAVFGRMLGTVTADTALMLGALGGVYLGGELVPRLGGLLAASGFRARFEAKGRFSSYLAQVPTRLITAPHPVFAGLGVLLAHHLRSGAVPVAQDGALLARIRGLRDELSRAEQRVADHLLAHPRAFMNEPVAEIARQAEVSQPTVIRFCRSLGFEGLSDFKLKLASGLTGTIPLRHSQVMVDDAAPDLSAKVLDNTVSAIVAMRDGLNGQAIERAIALLRQARRVEFHGVGNSHIVAVDGQYKFLRFGIPAMAHADSALQAMAADLLGPGDVVVAVSRSGAMPELLVSVGKALKAGAAVVAITASDSPLAREATVTLAVDHVEGRTEQLSMVSRVLHLLMIDVLAVGVAMNRPGPLKSPFGLREDAASWISHAR
ncbi:glucokinase [Aquabacterium sp.]|uniref:glucokinase n=1 Tax=Aquabacterium sp. TaxID=1872578 RepID=UPI0025BF01BD|nr:glucokinase [Aquabacterium sp.]